MDKQRCIRFKPPAMEMRLWDHLEELRYRLLRIVIALAVATTLAFFGSDWMLRCLVKPFPTAHVLLTALHPTSVFMQSLRLALIGGVVLSLPILLYQIWRFVAPGLSTKETKAILLSLYAGTFLFIAGVCFAYFLIVPQALHFFWSYSENLGIVPSWTIENYLSFVLKFLLSFGMAFELPLVLILLVRLKLVTPSWIASKRPYIIIFLAIAAALMTTPDVMSQLMLGIPLWLLFEISLYVAKLMVKE